MNIVQYPGMEQLMRPLLSRHIQLGRGSIDGSELLERLTGDHVTHYCPSREGEEDRNLEDYQIGRSAPHPLPARRGPTGELGPCSTCEANAEHDNSSRDSGPHCLIASQVAQAESNGGVDQRGEVVISKPPQQIAARSNQSEEVQALAHSVPTRIDDHPVEGKN